ncbi:MULTISPECIES: hypothetical protein [unclassified Streptomyces]|nr:MULTISPECIES: hypothetical protein [unclassified Streptomyces]
MNATARPGAMYEDAVARAKAAFDLVENGLRGYAVRSPAAG